MPKDIADLLTTTQAAERIGVERSTFFRWYQLGRVNAAYVMPGNRALLFDPDDIDALAEGAAS